MEDEAFARYARYRKLARHRRLRFAALGLIARSTIPTDTHWWWNAITNSYARKCYRMAAMNFDLTTTEILRYVLVLVRSNVGKRPFPATVHHELPPVRGCNCPECRPPKENAK